MRGTRSPGSPATTLVLEGTVVLEGTLDGVAHRMTLRAQDEQAMPLVRRGFHWINEHPFNR